MKPGLRWQEGIADSCVEKNRRFVYVNESPVSFVPCLKEEKISMRSLIRALANPPNACNADETPADYFSNLPVLETESLVLRPMEMHDAKNIYSYASDPEVSRYVLWEPHRRLSDTRSYIRYVRRLYRRGLPSAWAVVLKKDRSVIGSIGFVGYSTAHGSAEVGYSFARRHWNQGYATQALRAVIQSAFSRIGALYRLEAQHDVRNPASGKVMEKSGMTREGVLRGRIYNKGEHVDVVVYSVLRSDLSP